MITCFLLVVKVSKDKMGDLAFSAPILFTGEPRSHVGRVEARNPTITNYSGKRLDDRIDSVRTEIGTEIRRLDEKVDIAIQQPGDDLKYLNNFRS